MLVSDELFWLHEKTPSKRTCDVWMTQQGICGVSGTRISREGKWSLRLSLATDKPRSVRLGDTADKLAGAGR